MADKSEKINARKKDFLIFVVYRVKFSNSNIIKFESDGNSNVYIRAKSTFKKR